jgi:hypothetical protein
VNEISLNLALVALNSMKFKGFTVLQFGYVYSFIKVYRIQRLQRSLTSLVAMKYMELKGFSALYIQLYL